MSPRTEALLHSIAPASQTGLEVGALMTPIVTADMGSIRYLDHESTEVLREKYSSHRDVDVERIVAVDYVWSGNELAELVGDDGPFDYLIASHVLEHIPDPVSWLGQVRRVLRPGGVVSLALPDKRYSFDVDRSPSVTADVVEAYLRRQQVPGPRQVFDHHASAQAREGRIAWTEHDPVVELTPVHSLDYAWDITRRSFETGEYEDVHCWVFTPETFRSLVEDLARLDLIDFELERVSPTSNGEFFATLRAGRSATNDTPRARRVDPPQAELDSVVAERNRLARDLESTRAELAETRASTSWRITAPVRGLGTLRNRLRHELQQRRG
ncbi:hypothetical protein BH10ACT3_BH10ACT3_23920 [soil metagenome]